MDGLDIGDFQVSIKLIVDFCLILSCQLNRCLDLVVLLRVVGSIWANV